MSTATAPNPMGLKRICTNCGVRFYDMNNRPIICPACEHEFTGEVKVKGKRGRAAADKKEEVKAVVEKKEETQDEEIQEEDDGVEVVSLEDAETPSTDEDDPAAKLDDEENLDDIPDFEGEIDEDIGGDEALLESDEDD